MLVSAPIFVAQFPVVTDLPQHLGQVRLWGEALANPDGPYLVQWLTPYTLVYVVLGAAWAVVPGAAAGKLGLVSLGALFTGAQHWLAFRRRRPVEGAFLASALFLGTTLHWGFLSFLVGWPVFLWFWYQVEELDGVPNLRQGALLFVGAALLYASHALWLGAGLGWLLVSTLRRRLAAAAWVRRLVWMLPLVMLGAVSARRIKEGFDSAVVWGTWPTGRLSPAYWVEAALGGSRDLSGAAFLFAVLGWVGLAAYHRRGAPAAEVDRALAWTAAMFATGAFVLPTKYMNTVQFEGRWAAPALGCMLLAMPAPRVSARLRAGFSALAVMAVSLSTALNWTWVNKLELSGLTEALAALPERPKVLGLSYVRESEFVTGRPFIQTFSWAQVVAGGELNFSFADFAPMPVVYRTSRVKNPGWTPGLEWSPDRVTRRDFEAFDVALVGAPEEVHAELQARFGLDPLTPAGRWRLYEPRRAP